jgi:DNA polymerase elongation subunit (family B)
MTKFYTNVLLSKNEILLRGYENGRTIKERIEYRPYLFVPSRTESEFKTLDGKPVGKINFDSIRDAKDFVKLNKDVSGADIYGMTNYQYVFIYDNYKGTIDYDVSLISIVTIDIEVDIQEKFPNIEEADNEITLITISRNGKKDTFGCKPYDNKDPLVTYHQCRDENDLLKRFITIWASDAYCPDIITGWNVTFFDIPYIINRIKRVLGNSWANKLSPWGFLMENRIEIMGKEQQTWTPAGISTLDYLEVYKKFGFTIQENYTLDHVAYQELGERKLDYAEYGSLAGLQTGNWQLYTEYNIKDVDLVDRLDDKLKLIDLVLAMAYDVKCNYQDTFATVRPWDIKIHSHLLDQNIVIPQFNMSHDNRQIMGGYVKEPQIGMFDWVISFDLDGLYPNIIRQYNISPETFRGQYPGNYDINKLLNGYFNDPDHKQILLDNNCTATANMLMFTKEKKGFLPTLMQELREDRDVYKRKMLEAKSNYEKVLDKVSEIAKQLIKDIAKFNSLQMAKKIQANALYGSLANQYNRWYDNDFAEAITSSGQLTTKWIEQKINQYLNKLFKTKDEDYVIAADTDSVYIKAAKFLQFYKGPDNDHDKTAYLDKVCHEAMAPFIAKKYEELFEYMNAYGNHMAMKREAIAPVGVWTAAKRYILNVLNLEGVVYDEPKLKMTGIEAIRSSTPQSCRDAIKDALKIIMKKDEKGLQRFVSDFREKFGKLQFEDMSSPRSVKELEKYECTTQIYKKGTPINVKGALIYNHFLKKNKLNNKYEVINSGQKIKYSYLKEPNPLRASVIACPGRLPKELGLEEYIDYDMQFEKAFLQPIKTIAGVCGWECEERATLDSFFG